MSIGISVVDRLGIGPAVIKERMYPRCHPSGEGSVISPPTQWVLDSDVVGDEKTLRKNHKSKPRSERPFDDSAYHKKRE